MRQLKIYVGNLPYNATEEDLMGHFAQYGSVDEVKIIMDRETGRSRGFAFVRFSEEKEAENALAANGAEFQGRRLKVNLAREREGGSGGSGGAGRGNRGGNRAGDRSPW